MKTKMSSKGQIVLPVEIRELDHIQPGQQFEVERVQAGEYVLRKLADSSQKGLVDLLLSCPVKGWFRPLESESTDTLWDNR